MARKEVEALWWDDVLVPSNFNGTLFRMRSGREYVVASSLPATILPENRIAATRYLDEHPEENPVVFTTYNMPVIAARPRIPFSKRVQLLGRALVKFLDSRPGRLDFYLSPDSPIYLPLMRACYVDTADELIALLRYWTDLGVIDLHRTVDGHVQIDLSVRGLIELEQDATAADSTLAFVAMWFDPQMAGVYADAIAPAVESLGYEAMRIDKVEHNNKIDDEIIAGIRRARFLVADFSCGPDGARGGVYFEAGFAAGLGKPVIYTVREADFDKVHFDTRQINHIVWKDHEDLKSRLIQRIGATIGQRSV